MVEGESYFLKQESNRSHLMKAAAWLSWKLCVQ